MITILSASKRCVLCKADEDLFRNPVVRGVVLEKLLGEDCVQNMDKVLKGVTKLKKLAKKYAKVGVTCIFDLSSPVDAKQHPGNYDGQKVIARLYAFSEEFSARSWAQVSNDLFECY